ncbi:MAG: hypothetical protein FWB91_11635 [Defluviitaleaceae bacterium]|nr:hypothetical protein [Defluviitaleaceae bacterium]
MKEKASPYLAMALLAFMILGLEMIILFIESLFYGTMDLFGLLEKRGIYPLLIHWGLTCAVWITGAWVLHLWAKKRGFNIFENKFKAPVINWIIVCALFAISVVSSYIVWDMRFKPIAEFTGMFNLVGNQAVFTFIAQYIYYLFESVLYLAIIIFGQKYGELVLKKDKVPWGGILCGLTWGLVHTLTQGSLIVGLYSAISALIFGIVYILLKKNIRYAYPVIALMFML